MDDWAFIVEPGNLADTSLRSIILEPYHGFYRPFAFLVLRFAVALFGPMPFLYHLVNLGLFYGICRLVYTLIRQLSKNEHVAIMTASLYAVHPVHHPLISNSFTICLNVYILCGLLSLVWFIDYLDSRDIKKGGMSLALFIAALLSHLTALTLPAIMLIIARWRTKLSLTILIKELWPYLATLLCFVAFRLLLPGTRPLASLIELNLTATEYLATIWDLICWYHFQLIFPLRTIFIWDAPLHPNHALLKSLNLIVSILGIGYLLLRRWKTQKEGYWLMIHIMGLVPLAAAAFIYSPRTQTAIIEPLWFAISSIGIYALVCSAIYNLKGKIPAKSFNALIIGPLIGFALLTLGHNAQWRNERVFHRYWLSVNPNNAVSWMRWARSYREAEKPRLLTELSELTDYLNGQNSYLGWTYRAHIYNRMNQFPDAISDYTQALNLNPKYIEALLSRANCYALSSNWQAAKADLKAILELEPNHSAAMEDLQMVIKAEKNSL